MLFIFWYTYKNMMIYLTYLKIAELLYNNEDYLLSSYYYDSTAALLPQEYPDRDVIIERKDVLGELAQYINTVETEDSIQRIAALGEKERNKFFLKIKKLMMIK